MKKFDGRNGNQTPNVSAAKPVTGNQSIARPPKKPPAYPALVLNEREAAAALGISTNKFHRLRAEPWFPLPVELGPRALRWRLVEIEAVLERVAPRRRFMPEPVHLVEARAATK